MASFGGQSWSHVGHFFATRRFVENFVEGNGGAVKNNQGALSFTDCVFSGNVASAWGQMDVRHWDQGGVGGVDQGGCSNTLTKYHPTPVAKGNPQHTIRVKLSA